MPKFVVDLLDMRIHAVGDLTEGLTEGVPLGDPLPPTHTSWTARTDVLFACSIAELMVTVWPYAERRIAR